VSLSKFDELRLKTDRELLQLLNDDLNTGLGAACNALRSMHDLASAREQYLKAKRAQNEVVRLVHAVNSISEDERKALESRLNRLQRILEGLSGVAAATRPTEKDIAVLAQAFWQARGCPQGSPEEDWFRAEDTLRARSQAAPPVAV